MARARQFLFPDFQFISYCDYEQMAADLARRYPAAALYTEDQITEFMAAYVFLKQGEPRDLAGRMAQERVQIPVQLRFDHVRLCRYLLYRWKDLRIRQALLNQAGDFDVAHFKKHTLNSPNWVRGAIGGQGPVPACWFLQACGQGHRVPELLASLTAEGQAWRRAQLLHFGVLLHRCLTEPDLREHQPSRKEQKELIHRLRQRDLQLQSLRRSIYQMRMDRKTLIRRIREPEERARAELARLEAEVAEIQAELSASEVRHAAAVAEFLSSRGGEVKALEARLTVRQEDCARALAERNAWIPAYLLTGMTVAVVGGEGREAEYRLLVESAGGRMVHLSALEKINRIAEAVSMADIIIMMTDQAKHAAEQILRKAAPPEALFLRCPRTGLGAFERLLRTEVMPRLAYSSAAVAMERGAAHGPLVLPHRRG